MIVCGVVSNLVTVVHGDVCIVEVGVLVGRGEPALVGRAPIVVVVVHLPPPLPAGPVLRSEVTLPAKSVHAPIVSLAPTFTTITTFAAGQLEKKEG